MSDKKLFLVNKLSLEERLHERISQLENENKCLIETLHNKDALMNVEEEKQQLAYNQEHLDGLREALEVFNECFSQKNSVELTPSLEENITDEIIRNLEKSNDMWRFKEEDLAITAIERVFQKLKESIK